MQSLRRWCTLLMIERSQPFWKKKVVQCPLNKSISIDHSYKLAHSRRRWPAEQGHMLTNEHVLDNYLTESEAQWWDCVGLVFSGIDLVLIKTRNKQNKQQATSNKTKYKQTNKQRYASTAKTNKQTKTLHTYYCYILDLDTFMKLWYI